MALKKIVTPDQNLQHIQDNVDEALRKLQTSPFSNGNLLSGNKLKAGQDNIIAHKLGKTPSLILIGAPDASSTVYLKVTANLANVSMNNLVFNLWCSADCTVNVWVS